MSFIKRPFTGAQLRIVKNGVEYALPVGWSISDTGSCSFRNSLQDKAFSHGSYMVGDGKIDGRTITVEFDVRKATEQEHDEALNQALFFYDRLLFGVWTC